jgi:transposase-like protein
LRRRCSASPKQGIRATKPNEYWHIDVTIIKLLDGTKVYLHAVIDNVS